MTPIERLLAVAQAEVGYIGKASNSQLDDKAANPGGLYTKYARDMDALGDWYNGRKQGFDWCDVFADWCFVHAFGKDAALTMTCQPLKSCGAGCAYSLGYYKAKGRYFTDNPQPGDQIFFGTSSVTSHTGIVSSVSGSYVSTIEGNCGSPSAVRTCRYPLTYATIKGYGRPDYSIIEEDDEDMDAKRFRELWLEMRKEELQDNDASSWSAEARQWAIDNGIILGNGDSYMWEDVLTREQMATMLYRFAKLVGAA